MSRARHDQHEEKKPHEMKGIVRPKREHKGKEKKKDHKKPGGKVHGHEPKHRLDKPKRARGGAMTAGAPFSAAGKMAESAVEKGKIPAVDEGGKGKDRD